MKKIIIAITLLFVLSHLYSCGPSAAELAQAQKHRDDSIKAAVEKRFAVEAELKDVSKQLAYLRNSLKNGRAILEAENDRMNKIREWQFGRSTNEREEQIKNQSLRIQNIEDNIKTLQQKISKVEQRLETLVQAQ